MHVQMLVCDDSSRYVLHPASAGMTNRGSGAAVGEPQRQVWTFAESDYLFGAGPLRMTIDRVDWSAPRTLEGQTWYDVHGTEISADGRVIGPRQTAVKASRLRPATGRGVA